MDENILIGSIIHNHYRIETELGSGAYGSVYKAKHTKLGDWGVVAIKIWHDKNNSPEQRDSFRREAEMLARLKHRHILRFFDYSTGADENFPYPYLITEYAAKGSLRDLNQSHSHDLLPLEKVYAILSQIGQALHHAHKEKIIHRDLKPANILFNDQDEALLADFGIAAIASAPVMSTGKIYGTLHYMAPEQFNGKFSAQSDLYAIGVITYQMVTGCMPLTASGFIQWLRKHESNELPIDPTKHNHQLPEYIAQAILKALAKNPADRFDDIEAFLRALGVPLHQETIFITTQAGLHQEEVERWLTEGKAHLQDRRPKEALTAFDMALNLDPKSAEAYLHRGEVLVALGESWGAFTAFEMAVNYNPKLTDAYIRIGDIFSSNGNYQDALNKYSKAQQTKPDSPYIWMKIAVTLIKLDRVEEALHAYDMAINCTIAFNDSINLRNEKINLLFLYWLFGTSVQKSLTFISLIALFPGHKTRLRDKGNPVLLAE